MVVRHRGTVWFLAAALVGGILAGCTQASSTADPASALTTADLPFVPPEEPPEFVDDPGCFGLELNGLQPTDVRCGRVRVPAVHDEPSGDTISLPVAVLAGERSDRPPVLVLAGGPGEPLVAPALTDQDLRAGYDLGAEVILMDQRGAGLSVPSLDCPAVFDVEAGPTPAAELDAVVDALLTCRDRLADEGVDLTAYHHAANAADVDLVRRALSRPVLDLRGTSYGTQVAVLAAQLQPDGVRSLVLSSPVDPSQNWVTAAPATMQQALHAIAEACTSDAACADTFGSVTAAIETTVDRLAAGPESVTVDPGDGTPITIRYTPAQFLGSLQLLFFSAEGLQSLPTLVDAAAAGDLEPLAQITSLFDESPPGAQLGAGSGLGLRFTMLCSGEGAALTPEALRVGLEPGVVERYWLPDNLVAGDRLVRICEGWDVPRAYDPERVVLDHDVPALLVTGRFDQITSPAFGQGLAERWPSSVLVEVPDAGHAPLEALGPCGQALMRDFLNDPTTAPDDTCVRDREVAFVTQRLATPS